MGDDRNSAVDGRAKPSALCYRKKTPGRQRREALTREREMELIVRYKAGDRAALSELVRCSMHCVELTVMKVAGGEKEDKVQEGLLGLLRAAEKFKLDYGVRFWTYAAWFVFQRAQRCAYKARHLVSMPSTPHSRALLSRVGAVVAKHAAMTGRLPDTATIAELTGEKERDVEKAFLCLSASSVPLATTFGDFDGQSHEPVVYEDKLVAEPSSESLRAPDLLCEEKQHREARQETLSDAFAQLSLMEQQVLSLRYLSTGAEEKRTLSSVGQLLGGVSREWVRQVEKKAKEKIRRRAPEAAAKKLSAISYQLG